MIMYAFHYHSRLLCPQYPSLVQMHYSSLWPLTSSSTPCARRRLELRLSYLIRLRPLSFYPQYFNFQYSSWMSIKFTSLQKLPIVSSPVGNKILSIQPIEMPFYDGVWHIDYFSSIQCGKWELWTVRYLSITLFPRRSCFWHSIKQWTLLNHCLIICFPVMIWHF